MIVGIVALGDDRRLSTAYDAPRTAAPHARRRDSVFVVIAAWLRWQQALAVAERDAVALVWKRPARANLRKRASRFRRKVADVDNG